jgi:hypothetical protein
LVLGKNEEKLGRYEQKVKIKSRERFGYSLADWLELISGKRMVHVEL